MSRNVKTATIHQKIQAPRKGKISVHFNELSELIVEANTIYYRNNEADIVIASVRARRTTPKSK